MAPSTRFSDIGSSPGKATTIALGGLAAFVLLLLVLEEAGVGHAVTGRGLILFIALTVIVLGLATRTVNAHQFELAGRALHPFQNGMALAASWISIGVMTSLGGSVYAFGFDGALPAFGWMGGLALMAILLATPYRRSGAVTVPDFLSIKTGSVSIRFLATILVVLCCFGLLAVQISLAAGVAAHFLGIDRQSLVITAILAIAICTIPGGMRGASWAQISQFVILVAAFLVPAVWITLREAGGLIPQFATDGLQSLVYGLERGLVAQGLAEPGRITGTGAQSDMLNRVGLVITLATGVAVMPHLLIRTGLSRTASSARWSAFWGLILIGVLVTAAPVYATYTRLELFRALPGMAVSDLGLQAAWMFDAARLSPVAPIEICGTPILQPGDALAACGGADHVLMASDIALDPGGLFLAFSEIAGLPFVVHAMMVGGVLAAALSTATGLTLALALCLGGDLYFRIIDRNATANRRLFITRLILIAILAAVGWVALSDPAFVPDAALIALPLASAGLFPAIATAAVWTGVTAAGLASGMIAGSLATGLYLWATVLSTPWPAFPLPDLAAIGLSPLASGLIGLPLGFAVLVIVSFMTKGRNPAGRPAAEAP